MTPFARMFLVNMAAWALIAGLVVHLTGCAPAGFHYESARPNRGRVERAYCTPGDPFGRSSSSGPRVLVADRAMTPAESRAVTKDILILTALAVVPVWYARANQ